MRRTRLLVVMVTVLIGIQAFRIVTNVFVVSTRLTVPTSPLKEILLHTIDTYKFEDRGIPANDTIIRNFRGLYESQQLHQLCSDITKTITSDTIPPFYPYEGIGIPANLSDEEFDTTHFREYCSSDMPAIVIAYSAADNFDRRKAIRDTIGKQCEVYNCKIVFIVGMTMDKEIADRLKTEYAERQDIFIKDKIDTYFDLNNKVIAMLDWLLVFCQQPKYIIHIVDDSFINVKLYLQGLLNNAGTPRFAYGDVLFNDVPQRKIDGKYYTSPKQYPSKTFPDYIVGISYAFTNSLTRELRCAVHKARYHWLEDVWLMGEIRTYLGFDLINSEYTYWNIRSTPAFKDVPDLICIHYADMDDFYLYNHFKNNSIFMRDKRTNVWKRMYKQIRGLLW